MTPVQQKIQYMHDYYSYAEVSRQTGVPYRTLLAIKNRGQDPGSGNINLINKFWNRFSYHHLTDEGLPPRLAQNIRGGSVTRITETVNAIQDRLTRYAQSAVTSATQRAIRDGTTIDTAKLFDEVYAKLVDSFRRSKQPIDEVLYGIPS